MDQRVNLCKVPPDLRARLNTLRGEQNWREFMEDVATAFEKGVSVKTERSGGQVNETQLDVGEKHESISELMAVSISYAVEGYVCDECGDEYPLPQVMVFNNGERVVCSGCITVEDRIID